MGRGLTDDSHWQGSAKAGTGAKSAAGGSSFGTLLMVVVLSVVCVFVYRVRAFDWVLDRILERDDKMEAEGCW